MKKIFLSTQTPGDKTAATKAKVDVENILVRAGYHTVFFPKLSSISVLTRFWKELSKIVTKDSHIVLEYPCWPYKRITLIYLFCLVKRVRLYGIVHDIGALRFNDKIVKDLVFLKMFDGLISHNASMTAWLREKGYRKKIVNLEVFDYCLDDPKSYHAQSVDKPVRIFYAGNLSYKKATYLYDKKLNGLNKVELCVYGQHFEKERINGSKIKYKGVFNPGHPELGEEYHFGLIWEGTSLDVCDGEYGNYIRYNNPHKFSLYLSLGLPVLVWKEAAITPFVLRNNIGLAVTNFDEMQDLASGISNEKYKELVKNVNNISEKVQNGVFLQSALKELIKPNHV